MYINVRSTGYEVLRTTKVNDRFENEQYIASLTYFTFTLIKGFTMFFSGLHTATM